MSSCTRQRALHATRDGNQSCRPSEASQSREKKKKVGFRVDVEFRRDISFLPRHFWTRYRCTFRPAAKPRAEFLPRFGKIGEREKDRRISGELELKIRERTRYKAQLLFIVQYFWWCTEFVHRTEIMLREN